MTFGPPPSKSKKMGDYLSAKLHGQPVATPPGEPVSREKAMTAGISDLLAGKPAPSDTADAPAGVQAETWADANRAARDPQDPSYEIATALLTVAAALADLTKGSQP
jgi:hypothetical protein